MQNASKGFAMIDFLFIITYLTGGILLVWYSKHEKSYNKTVEIQGENTAKKKFRIIKFCGFILMIGALVQILSIL
jgi:hypothetical protein